MTKSTSAYIICILLTRFYYRYAAPKNIEGILFFFQKKATREVRKNKKKTLSIFSMPILTQTHIVCSKGNREKDTYTHTPIAIEIIIEYILEKLFLFFELRLWACTQKFNVIRIKFR